MALQDISLPQLLPWRLIATSKDMPRHLDAKASDVILSDAEGLVPVLVEAGRQWQQDTPGPRLVDGVEYRRW